MTYAETSVIVINQNGLLHLEGCFRSLVAHTPKEVELVLLDNNSTDGSVDWVQTHYPQVRIISHAVNQGFAGGYDQAIRGSTREYAVLLNNDTAVTEQWLNHLLAPFHKSDVAIVGARLMNFYDHQMVDHLGGLIHVAGGGIDLAKHQKPSAIPTKTFPTGFACGGGMVVKKSVFMKLGGFSKDYVIYHEDVDLAWRAWLAGYKVMNAPSCAIYHKGGASMGEHEKPTRVYLAQKNRLSNMIKNADPILLIRGLNCSCAFDLFRVLKWLVTFRWGSIAALCRANFAVLKALPDLLKQRAFVQHELRKRTDRELWKLGVFASEWSGLLAYLRR